MTVITKLTLKDHQTTDQALETKAPSYAVGSKTSRSKKLLSANLFNDTKELMIEHQNEVYYLRITKQNKLILTK